MRLETHGDADVPAGEWSGGVGGDTHGLSTPQQFSLFHQAPSMRKAYAKIKLLVIIFNFWGALSVMTAS